MTFRRHAAVVAIAGLVLSLGAVAPARAQAPSSTGEVVRAARPVAGQYIVTFDDAEVSTAEVGITAENLAAEHHGTVSYVYRSALRGFAIQGINSGEAQALLEEPGVAAVEEVGRVHLATTQNNPPWGLDRIDQRGAVRDNQYTYTNTGNGVHAYIIDTGIRITHTDFGGRASVGVDTVGDGHNGIDCQGHGTHVAGIVGGTTRGVAKQVSLVAVRVLNCVGGGTIAGVIAGVDWVTANAVHPAVANMSLGGGVSPAENLAVTNSINSGVTYAVAAGNDEQDACNVSPASVPAALTVGAMGRFDSIAGFSNFGSCVDLMAPGMAIRSDWIDTDTDTNEISGTSQATPHVAGVAARYLQAHPAATPASVGTAIMNNTLRHRLRCVATSPDRLLYAGFLDGVPPGPIPVNPPAARPPNDNFASSINLTPVGEGTRRGFTTRCSTHEAGEPNHAGGGGVRSSWYHFTPTGSGVAVVDTSGSGYDTVLAVYTGGAVNALSFVASNDDFAGTLQSQVTFFVTQGTTYRVAVDSFGDDAGDIKINWSAPSIRPDGLVRRSGPTAFVGNDIYNTTAANQTVNSNVARGTTGTFFFKVTNDGTINDNMTILGSGSSPGFTVRWFDGPTDVTSQVVAGTYALTAVPINGFKVLRATVAVANSRPVGATRTLQLTVTSSLNTARTDVVRGVAHVT